MSTSSYEAKLPQIQAITGDAIKKPNMPVKIFLQEAENLFHWAQQDQAALKKARLDWALVEDLPTLAGALREAESRWSQERHSREDAMRLWDVESPQAYALRDQLLRAMRYAYRRDETLLRRVSEITAGSGHADMIQDLNDIATLGRQHSAPLVDIDLDLAELQRAADTAGRMADLLAQVNGERSADNTARVVRDQAYTLLKQAVDEVRACGQYVFWDSESRRLGYHSDYLRSLRKGSGSKAETPESAEAIA